MKKKFTKEQFMKAAGINTRQKLHQLMNGYTSYGKFYPPVLAEGKDYKKEEIIFFESALKKLKQK